MLYRTVLAWVLSTTLFAVSVVHAAPGKGNKGGGGSGGNNTIFISFAVDVDRVTAGDSVDLSWATSGARSCVASGGWDGKQNLSGSYTTAPLNEDTQFRLTCKNRGLSELSVLRVAVIEPSPEPVPPEPDPAPEPPPPESDPGPQPPPPDEPAPLPTVSFVALPTEVDVGGEVTLTWSSTDATGCTATGDWSGELAADGAQVLTNVSDHKTLTLSCSGPGGTAVALTSITAMGKVSLQWTPPASNVDGTPIEGLLNYQLYVGQNSGDYVDELTIGGDLLSYELRAPVGQHFVAMRATDLKGATSAISNEIVQFAQ